MASSIYFPLCALPFSILLMILYLKKEHIDTKETKIFGTLIILNFLGLIIEMGCTLASIIYNEYEIISTIIYKLYLLYIISWISTFAYYVYSVVKTDEINFNSKKVKIFVSYYLIVSMIMAVLPINSIIKDNFSTRYTSGPSVIFAYFISLIAILVVIICLIVNHKKVKSKKMLPVYIFLIIGSIAIYIQTTHPEILLMTYIETFITMIMYFTIENPDVQMLEQVKIAKDTAEKANHAKSDFLSNMSHEIRTPLNAIVGFSESLKDDNIPPESQEKVDDIIMASNNLLELVNGILDISKIEANKLEIVDKEYNINSMLDELIALTKARIGDKGLDFRINIDKSLPSVLYGDNVRLKQIILNILTNAVKYTKEGYIDFTISSIIQNDVCRLIVSVEDSGIGIKEENIPKLFSKFERLNVEKQLTIEGTGLGLAITKKLVDLMHGKIIVQSIYGKGSKFTISIDQRIVSFKPETIKETKKSQTSVIDATGSKLLIVDDNELNIKVAKTLLNKYHFTIDSCTSGLEAIAKIKDHQTYDIILLDDMMPKMSGRQVLKELKNTPNFNIPIIVLTANAIDGMKEEYLNLGFDDYLAKPINKKELERIITKYINLKNISNTAGSHANETTSIIKDNIDLPKIKEALVEESEASEPKSILIVDDNELNLKVAQTMLKHYGYQITLCNSGRSCISKVIENKYDLILMDDMMPDLNGCETLKNLHDLENFDTPVILVTAASKDEVQNKITTYGFADYLGKPLNKELLNDTILKYLK